MRLRRRIEVGESRARTADGSTRLGVYYNGFHLRKVDEQAAVAERFPCDVMSPTANCDEQVVLPRELDGRAHVVGALALYDQRGLFVDHGVPDGARLVVAGITGAQHSASDLR